MENLKERASEVSYYLQRLTDPKIFSEVQRAVERKDENAFIKACKKAKIPTMRIADLRAILSTPVPTQWPWPP